MKKGKRKFGNRVVSVFLALLLLFSMVPTSLLSVAAASSEEPLPNAGQIGTEDSAPQNSRLTITVKDDSGAVISGASVTIGSETVSTDVNGVADFGEKADGKYSVTVSKAGYVESVCDITKSGEETGFEVFISKNETVEDAEFTMKGKVKVDGTVNNGAVKSVVLTDLNSKSDKAVTLQEDGSFEVTLTAGVNYKITVTPENEKAFSAVEKTFVADKNMSEEFANYELASNVYSVSLNGEEKGSYKYGEECSVDISREGYSVKENGVSVKEGESNVSFKRDGSIITFTVNGNTAISVEYSYTVSFKAGENGDITVENKGNGKSFSVTESSGNSVSYKISADAGYYVSSVTVNGDEKIETGSKVTVFEGTAAKNAEIVATFAVIEYKIHITLQNSNGKKGSASVKKGKEVLASVSDSGEEGSATADCIVVYENGKYALELTTEVKDKYRLKYSIGGSEKDVKDNKISLENITSDMNVTILVEPIPYELTFVDPLEKEDKDKVRTVSFNVEDKPAQLPTLNKKGYTFLGWSTEVPNGEPKNVLSGEYDYMKFADKTVLYAVYTVNAASAKAKSTVTYLSHKEKEEDKTVSYNYSKDSDSKKVTDDISTAWFGNDVTVELTSLKGVNFNVAGKGGEADTATIYTVDNNSFVLGKKEGGMVSTAVEVGGSISHTVEVNKEKVTIVYALEKAEFTVNIDAVAPSLDVVNNNTSEEASKASDKITASDNENGSGLASVEYAVIKENTGVYSDILKGVSDKNDFKYAKELKEKLRAENWIEIDPADGSYCYTYELKDDEYVVYRAVDKAGNDTYSSFDRTVPEIKNVEFSYSDGAGNQKQESGSIYTSGTITVTATVYDRRLFYIDKTNQDYKYDGCKLVISELGNDNNKVVLSSSKSAEKWSPFRDKWDVKFVVDKEADYAKLKGILDKELKFTITAEDQAGNKAESYTTGSAVVFVETKAPEISVNYEYGVKEGNTESKLSSDCAEGKTIYSSNDVTAEITVEKQNFDPYWDVDGKSSAASVAVKVNDEEQENVAWTKTKDKWTATVTLSNEGEYNISVEAKSQAGTTGSYTSGTLIVDKTAPEVEITYSNDAEVYLNGTSAFNNGNTNTLKANISIKDTYFGIGNENGEKTNAVVKIGEDVQDVTWDKTESNWTTSVELTKDQGAYTISVEATDRVGNAATKESTFCNDNTAPEITGVSLAYEDGSRVLNILTFGIFFNDKIKVTVKANDGTESYCSGLKTVELRYPDAEQEKTVTGEINEDGDYVFELPDGDAEKWKAELSVVAIDNVGNEKTVLIHEISGEDVIETNHVLYEKEPATVSFAFEKYEDTATKTQWIIKDKEITVTVDDRKDENDEKFASGLNKVKIVVEGEAESKTLVEEDCSASYLSNKSYTVEYNDLYEGKNVIKVTAEDNAGNETSEQTVTVYKDSKNPTIDGVKIFRSNEENDIAITNRSYGNFYNGAVRVDVSLRDEKFSSGIKSLSLEYVYTDENNKEGTIAGKMLKNADKKDKKDEEEGVLNVADTEKDVAAKYTFALEPLMKEDKEGNKTLVDTDGYLKITVVDNVGNSYVFDNKSDEKSLTNGDGNIKKNLLMFEDNGATFESSLSDPTYTCGTENEKDGRLWYKDKNVKFTVNVSDTAESAINSGLKSVNIVLKNAAGEHKVLEEALGKDKLTESKAFEELELKDYAAEGENTVVVTARDNANNKTTYAVKFYIDVKKPVVDSFSFKGVNGKQELTYNECKTVTKTDYGYYFSKDTEVTVHVSDACPSSGISKVYFVAIPAENAKPNRSIDTSEALVTECDVEGKESNGILSTTATFTVKANFKGQIYAYVEDNVGYTSLNEKEKGYDQWVRPDGLIVETQAMHNRMSDHIKIEILSKPVAYLNGTKNPLFSNNVKLRLSIDDSYSGIRDVTYKVVAAHDTGKNFGETLVVKNGTKGWTSEKDLNLTTFLSKEITVSNNSNDIKIYLSMTDNSGNVTTNEKNPLVISIDKDAPVVTVSFDRDDKNDDAEFTGFFKTDRKMTVKVKERNFNKKLVKITATADERPYAISSGFGKGVEVVENGIQYFVYTMTYVFHNDADYTFAIAASDKAGNDTADKNVNYGSAAAKAVAKKFTIDQTKPEITVNISGQKGKDIYYKGDVTVEIKVVEHNYVEERYDAVFSMRNPQSGAVEKVVAPTPTISGSGDEQIHTYVFTQEYMSSLESIRVVDKAGNEKDAYSGSYAGEDFVVDKTNPTIQFFTNSGMQTKLDGSATQKKTVAPYIVIKDTNLDVNDEGDFDIQLKGNYNGPGLSGRDDYTFSYIRDSLDPTILKIAFNGFTNKEDVDDIYTFTVTAVDKAGCVTTESAVFSVNRYGSTFMVSKSTETLLTRYYTNSPQDIKIVQINAAAINNQRVSVTRNGIAADLVEGTDYTITNKAPGSGKKNTDSNWYECTYTIFKKNFDEEGIYSVTVYSKDSAESVLTSATSKRTMYLFKDTQRSDSAVVVDEKSLEAPVNFQIDKVAPTASIVGVENGDQYFSGSKQFMVYAEDGVCLDYAVVSIDGEKTTYTDDEMKAGVTKELLKNDGTPQSIEVEAHDVAGNVFKTETVSVQVTTNPYEWFIRNTIAQIVAGILVLMLIVCIIIIMRRRRLTR